MSQIIAREPWEEERIGMNVLGRDQDWALGGPMVIHSPWWIREHWGRLFEIDMLWETGFGHASDRTGGHGVVVLRKESAALSREELERIDPKEPRELDRVAAQHRSAPSRVEAPSRRCLRLRRQRGRAPGGSCGSSRRGSSSLVMRSIDCATRTPRSAESRAITKRVSADPSRVRRAPWPVGSAELGRSVSHPCGDGL